MNSGPYIAIQTNRLRHEELLRQAADHAQRGGQRKPRRRRGRHRTD